MAGGKEKEKEIGDAWFNQIVFYNVNFYASYCLTVFVEFSTRTYVRTYDVLLRVYTQLYKLESNC